MADKLRGKIAPCFFFNKHAITSQGQLRILQQRYDAEIVRKRQVFYRRPIPFFFQEIIPLKVSGKKLAFRREVL
ncbi:hypothetical protein D9M69_516010 [compost metagenome]